MKNENDASERSEINYAQCIKIQHSERSEINYAQCIKYNTQECLTRSAVLRHSTLRAGFLQQRSEINDAQHYGKTHVQTNCPGDNRSYTATPGSCRHCALAKNNYHVR